MESGRSPSAALPGPSESRVVYTRTHRRALNRIGPAGELLEASYDIRC